MGRLVWEVIERTVTGPVMAEEEFETDLLPSALASIQAKHRIEWDPDEPVMTDPSLADAIYAAGRELLLEVLGPVIMAKAVLSPDDWAAAHDDLVALYEDANEADGEGLAFRAEYLETVISLPG